MKKTIGASLSLFILLSGQQSAFALEDGKQNQGAYTLGEVVVSAEKTATSEQAGTLYRVTQADIEASGASTLDQALELVPGLNVREGAEGTPRIDVRGFRTRHVHLFLNGIPIRNTNDGQFDPTVIPAEIISEIKVLAGGSSVLYGSGGNGAVIDIITKAGAPGVHGRIDGKIGTGDLYEINGGLYGASEKLSFYGNVGMQTRNYFPLSDNFTPTGYEDGDERLNSDRQRVNFFGNMSYALTDDNTVGLTLSRVTGDNGKPPTTNYDKNDAFSKKPKYERIDDLSSTMVQAAFAHEGAGPWEYRAWVYFSQTDTEENGYDDSSYTSQTKTGAFYQDSEVRLAGAHAQAGYSFADTSKLTFGLTGEKESWQADGFEITKSGTSAIDSDEDLSTYSLALEYQRAITDKWQLVLGYGHHFQNRSEDDDNDFSYMIGTSYDLTDSTRIKANHARKVRFASLKQLYDGTSGNPDLNTEITTHYELGVEQQLTATSVLDVTGFVINATDFIEKDEVSGFYENYQDLRFYGIESTLAAEPVENLRLRCGVTWMQTEDRSNGNTRDDLQYRPTWKATLDGQYDFDFGLKLSGSVIYVAEQYYYDKNMNKAQLNDFTLVNLKLSQKIPSTPLEVYGGVDNLFDEDYEESYGLPQPGRLLYAGLVYKF